MTCPPSALAQFRRFARSARHGRLRGFTLTEVVVVILMIAIMATVASPAFVRMMRDSALSRINMQIAEIYRKAYIESAEQSTYLVRWTGGNAPRIELIRATLDTPFPQLVSPRRCNAIDWNDPAHTKQTLGFNGAEIGEYASVGYLTNTGELKTQADVCYSQRKAFVRYNNQDSFVEMPAAGRIFVKNLKTNLTRRVLIPSYGLPRLIQ